MFVGVLLSGCVELASILIQGPMQIQLLELVQKAKSPGIGGIPVISTVKKGAAMAYEQARA